MQYEPLRQGGFIKKDAPLAYKIIVKALESDRGDIIREMGAEELKMMVESVTCAVSNKLDREVQLAYDKYVLGRDCIASDQIAEFKPRPDVEIVEEVTAYFEIDGKLQYRDVKFESFIDLPRIDKSVECVIQQMNNAVRGLQFDSFSVAGRLEEADILTNDEIMEALLDVERWGGDDIIEMNYAEFKQLRKEIFSFYYHDIYAKAEGLFEELCEDYVPERDGIENDPRKNFKPKTEVEIDQEINAYFEEQDTLQ